MSENENSYLQKYLKKLNPTIEIKVKSHPNLRNGPDFHKPKMVRSLKTQSVEFGPKEPSELLKPRIARVRSSRDQFRTDQLRKPVFDEPEPAQSPLLVRPKKLDPLKPNEHYISETRLSEMSQTVLGSEPSLSSVNLADHGIQGLEDDDDDEMLVNRSLRSIRGSAKRKIQKIKSISEFHKPPIKPATPVREPRNRHPTSVRPTPSNEKANDLSVLDILSENRKKSRNRIRIMIDGKYRTLTGPFKIDAKKDSHEYTIEPLKRKSDQSINQDNHKIEPSHTQNESPMEQSVPKSNHVPQQPPQLTQANCESPMTPINEPPIVSQRPGSFDETVRSTGPGTHVTDTGRRIMSDKPRQRKEEFHVEEYYVKDMNQSDQKLETRYIYKFDPGAHQNPFGRSDTHVLTGNGSSTYPGFERRISSDKNERESRKLTDKLQEFKICGRPKQISKQKSFDEDESGKYNPDEDQLGTGNSKLPFPGCEDFDARIVEAPRPRSILKRPKSLPIRKQYSSFVDSPKPTASPNRRASITAKTKLQEAIDTLPDFKTHWETLIEHINNVRDLAIEEREIIMPKATEVTNLIIAHCNNIRSKITGAAIDALRDIFLNLKRALVPCIEPAIKSLMLEAGKENVFLKEKCEKCLQTIVEVMSETTGSTHKLISCFHGQSKSKNVAARELTARYIEQTLMIISPQRALADTRDLTEKIILSMISALNDSAHETRQYGKRIVVLLAKYEHFEAICGKYLSSEDNRKVLNLKNQTGDLDKSLTKLKAIRSSFSHSSPKRSQSTKTIIIPGLKEELMNAKKSTSSKEKIKSIQIMKQHICERGSLGNEITNGVDLLCAMISSAVTTNYRTGLEAAHLFIPLIRNEKILLTNLVKVLADKVNSSRNNVIPLLDQIQKECHSSVLLPLYSNRIIQTTNGRSEIGKYFTELCQKIKETKPSMVIKYGKQAFWVMCKDRSCTQEMNELGQILYELMGDSLYEEANRLNLSQYLSTS